MNNITLSYETMTAIYQDGETASFECVLNVKQENNTTYTIYFYVDGEVLHITLNNVACIVSGVVDVLY